MVEVVGYDPTYSVPPPPPNTTHCFSQNLGRLWVTIPPEYPVCKTGDHSKQSQPPCLF